MIKNVFEPYHKNIVKDLTKKTNYTSYKYLLFLLKNNQN